VLSAGGYAAESDGWQWTAEEPEVKKTLKIELSFSCSTQTEGAMMNLVLDNVEQDVVDSLNDLEERSKSWSIASSRATEFTREVKMAIGLVGKKYDCTICSSEHEYCEWLYDLCWRNLDENDLVLNLPLVMECEWHTGYDELLDDFQKLLVARADHRVFLCQQKPEHWAERVGQFIEQVRRYDGTKAGDRYLFGSWTVDGWHFKQYIVGSGGREPETPSGLGAREVP
jgi:hypothetical protein